MRNRLASGWRRLSEMSRDRDAWRGRLRTSAPALVVFSLAVSVRLIYNATVAAGYTPAFDAAIYDQLARNLLGEHCYCFPARHVTAFRPPFWPYIIAAIYAIMGERSVYIRLFCCLLGAGTCVIVYLLARDFFGRRVALVTGCLAAVYAGLFIWDGWLYSESLYIFLQMVFLFALARMLREQRRVWVALCGVSLGLAALTRPNGAVLLALACLWGALVVVFRLAPWRRVAISLGVIALLALAINLPWTLRTYGVTHSLAPVSTVGTTLAGAYNDMTARAGDQLYGIWWLPMSLNADFHNHSAADEQALTQRALTWIAAHPDQTRALLWAHLQHMWTPYLEAFDGLPFEQFPNRPSSRFVRDILIPDMSYLVFMLAALGLVVTAKRRWSQLLPIYLAIGVTIIQNIVFYGSPRFRAPIEPLLVLLAGGFLWWLHGLAPALLQHRWVAERGTVLAVSLGRLAERSAWGADAQKMARALARQFHELALSSMRLFKRLANKSATPDDPRNPGNPG